MKTKITILVSAIALITLSFTFANVDTPRNTQEKAITTSSQTPVGGLLADQVEKR
jgi:hypothetical protein